MRIVAAAVLCSLLAGCAGSQTVGSFFYLKPYKFEDLSCADHKKKTAESEARVKDYQSLRDKAAQNAGGGAIGAVVYTPDYQRTAWERDLFAGEYARRNCADPPPAPPPPTTPAPTAQAPTVQVPTQPAPQTPGAPIVLAPR